MADRRVKALRRLIRRRTVASVAGVCGLLAASVLTGVRLHGASGTTGAPLLEGVTASSLAAAQVRLDPTTHNREVGSWSTLTASDVERASLDRDPGASIIDSAVVRFVDTLPTPPFECLCWVVATTPSSPVYVGAKVEVDAAGNILPQPHREAVDPVHLDVYDATTGAFIYGVEGSRSD